MKTILVFSIVVNLGFFGTGNGETSERLYSNDWKEVFDVIKSPSDTLLQRDVKEIIAQYFVESDVLTDDEQALSDGTDVSVPSFYGTRHKHQQTSENDRYNELLMKLQEQEKEIQRLKQAGIASASSPTTTVSSVPAPTSIPDASAQPATSQAKQENAGQEKAKSSTTTVPILTVSTTVAATTAPVTTQKPKVTTTPKPTTRRPTIDPVHHISQVNKILGNVANGNIVGIVDESLAIRATGPVRNLVTNIMKVIFCNPIDRLLRRCAPNQIDASKNSATG